MDDEPGDDDDSGDDDDDRDDDDSGDDDDVPVEPSTEDAAPPPPPWMSGTPTASLARDLDGDGLVEGLYVITEGDERLLVVVDGAQTSLFTFLTPLPSSGANAQEVLRTVTHDGCRILP